MKISKITFIPCRPEGTFLGFCNLLIDDYVELNSLGIHSSSSGIKITFPAKKLKSGFLKFDWRILGQGNIEELKAAIESHLEEIGFSGTPTIIE